MSTPQSTLQRLKEHFFTAHPTRIPRNNPRNAEVKEILFYAKLESRKGITPGCKICRELVEEWIFG